MVLGLLVFAAAATAAAPPPLGEELGQIEVVARAQVVGTLQQGVQAYRPEFFTPVRPGTAMDMIQWLPGFTFEDTRDMRGLGGAIGNVLIDGQPPTSKTDTLATVLRRTPASQVERVDIIVGSAPGIDMRGRAVIANVVLKKTTAPRGAVTLGTSIVQDGVLAPEFLANISRKTDERSAEASLNVRYDLFRGPLFGEGTLLRTDGAGRTVFLAEANTRGRGLFANPTASYEFPFGAGKLRVNGSARYIRGEFIEQTLVGAERSGIELRDRYRQGEAGVRYARDFSARTALESQFLHRVGGYEIVTENRRVGVAETFSQDQLQTESVARTTLRFKPGERLTVEGAAEAAFNGLDTDATLIRSGLPVPIPASDVAVRERRGDVSGTVTWKPAKAIGVTAALRAEASTLTASRDVDLERSLTYLKPRLVLSWSPDAKTQVRLRAEHEVNQINFGNFAASVEFNGTVRSGNPDLRPRRAWVSEAVVERQFWTGASIVATVRHQSIRDVVDSRLITGLGGAVEVANIGDGRQTDLIATLTLPMKRLGLDGAMLKTTVTRTFSAVTDPTTGERRRITFVPEVAGEVHFSHDLPQWKVTWGVDYIYTGSTTIYRPGTLEVMKPWPRLSAFVEYRVRPELTLRAEVFNLNDAAVPQTITYFTASRPAAVLYADRREIGEGPFLFLRARRTLN